MIIKSIYRFLRDVLKDREDIDENSCWEEDYESK